MVLFQCVLGSRSKKLARAFASSRGAFGTALEMAVEIPCNFRTWFSRHGGVGLMVGLDDLRGLFQP